MFGDKWCVVILAAGKGKRMKSDLPKVLHKVAGIPMVLRVFKASKYLTENIVVVVGHKSELVKDAVLKESQAVFALQENQNGTGDAVRSALDCIDDDVENVMVLCGDSPLIKGSTLKTFAQSHEADNNSVSVLAMNLDNPQGYGRIVTKGKEVIKIVEQADASIEERGIKLVNSGIYCFKKDFLFNGLKQLGCDNAQGEYYLTDLIGFAAEASKEQVGFHGLDNPFEAMGVNSPEELRKAESMLVSELSIV